jgi:hypothetical protein
MTQCEVCKSAQDQLSTTAYQRADPTPFTLPGMHWEDIPNREVMVRVMVSSQPQAHHKNVAIMTINPFPRNILHGGENHPDCIPSRPAE